MLIYKIDCSVVAVGEHPVGTLSVRKEVSIAQLSPLADMGRSLGTLSSCWLDRNLHRIGHGFISWRAWCHRYDRSDLLINYLNSTDHVGLERRSPFGDSSGFHMGACVRRIITQESGDDDAMTGRGTDSTGRRALPHSIFTPHPLAARGDRKLNESMALLCNFIQDTT